MIKGKNNLILPFFIRITRWVGFIYLFPPLFLSVPFSPSIHSLNLGEIRFFRLFELFTQAINFRLCDTKRANHLLNFELLQIL
nr:MAG TPA: hypothetical protein [Caudoviricetes sp.]